MVGGWVGGVCLVRWRICVCCTIAACTASATTGDTTARSMPSPSHPTKGTILHTQESTKRSLHGS